MMKLINSFWLLFLVSANTVLANDLDWDEFMSDRDMNLPDLGYKALNCSPNQTAVLGPGASFKLGGEGITLTELDHERMSERERQLCLGQAQFLEQIPDHISSRMGHQYMMNYSRCYELHMVGRPVEMAACSIDVNGGTSDDIIRCQSDYLLEIRFNGFVGFYQQTQLPFIKENITTSYGECSPTEYK